MAGKCTPPKSVSVKSYDRGTGAAKRRRKAAAKKARAAKLAAAGPYWTCVQFGTGRTCGTRHKRITASVAHVRKLDKAARAYAARFKRKPQLWHSEQRGK